MKEEIRRLWKLRNAEIVAVVIGVLGSVSAEFDRWMGKLGITCNVGVMQRREYSVSLWSFNITLLTVITTART